MVAEARDVDAGDLAGLEDGEALGDLDGESVDRDFDGVIGGREVDAGATDRGRRRFRCGGGRGFGGLEIGSGRDGSEGARVSG